MISIQFRRKEEAQQLYERLVSNEHAQYSVEWNSSPKNIIRIKCDALMCSLHTSLIPIMTEFIIAAVESRWMCTMIRQMFYFTDEEEQEQILSIARSLLEGEREDKVYNQKVNSSRTRKQLIEGALDNFLTSQVSFVFESFLHFRLKEYRERLMITVEAAIDEYKLEQEYQAFIEQLRYYLSQKHSLYWELHVVAQENFEIFLPSGTRFEQERLLMLIDDEVWKMNELDANLSIIAPLISIAPAQLYIYTNEPDNGVVRTLQNIFLERVSILDKEKWFHLN